MALPPLDVVSSVPINLDSQRARITKDKAQLLGRLLFDECAPDAAVEGEILLLAKIRDTIFLRIILVLECVLIADDLVRPAHIRLVNRRFVLAELVGKIDIILSGILRRPFSIILNIILEPQLQNPFAKVQFIHLAVLSSATKRRRLLGNP